MADSMDAAMILSQIAFLDTKSCLRPSGSVFNSEYDLRKTDEKRYSFHAIIKAYINTVTITETDRGIIILQITPNLEQPSISADSSME